MGRTLELSKKLIALRTDPDNRPALEQALAVVLAELPGFCIERFERNSAKSVLIHNARRGTRKFEVVLNGHLDVIPGKPKQYHPRVKGKRLYGVGSMDMKANVAALIAAFKAAAPRVPYPLALQIVTDEEIGGFDGTKLQIDKGVRGKFVIAGETTNFNIVNRAKGVLWLKIACKGKTAHGAYPWRGDNAVVKMNTFIERLLEHYPVPHDPVWGTTINVSSILSNNKAFNKIPDLCEVCLDIRYVPEQTRAILRQIRKLLPKDFSLEVVADEPALNVSEQNTYLQHLKRATERVLGRSISFYGAQGSSDARHFARIGCPGVEFGPIGGGIGTDTEWVDIQSLERYQEVLLEFLLSLKGSKRAKLGGRRNWARWGRSL